jgi:hypothetical protein
MFVNENKMALIQGEFFFIKTQNHTWSGADFSGGSFFCELLRHHFLLILTKLISALSKPGASYIKECLTHLL